MNDFKEIIEECVARKDFYNADRMKRVYLEYRRANNIFEVGDNVVGLDSIRDDVMTIEDISCNRKIRNGNIAYTTKMAGDFGYVSGLVYRHATDEEIAAGHRL